MRNMTLIEGSGKFQTSVGRSVVPLEQTEPTVCQYLGWCSRPFLGTMVSTHLRACNLYHFMSKVAFCYVRCLTCMLVLMFHTRAARSAKSIVVGSTAFVADEQAATYHRSSQFVVYFPVLRTSIACEITMLCVFLHFSFWTNPSILLNCEYYETRVTPGPD